MRWFVPLLVVLLLVAGFASLLAGTVWLTPEQALGGLLAGRTDLASLILVEIRLPRLILGLMVGAILGLSGAVLQG
ncbi:MAG: iron chelate uptake ABC transporter family permease subunit, partial [Sphingopyxis sp.]